MSFKQLTDLLGQVYSTKTLESVIEEESPFLRVIKQIRERNEMAKTVRTELNETLRGITLPPNFRFVELDAPAFLQTSPEGTPAAAFKTWIVHIDPNTLVMSVALIEFPLSTVVTSCAGVELEVRRTLEELQAAIAAGTATTIKDGEELP